MLDFLTNQSWLESLIKIINENIHFFCLFFIQKQNNMDIQNHSFKHCSYGIKNLDEQNFLTLTN